MAFEGVGQGACDLRAEIRSLKRRGRYRIKRRCQSLQPATGGSFEELLEDLRSYRGSQLQELALGAVELVQADPTVDELDLARDLGAVGIHVAAAESAVLAKVPNMTAESSRPSDSGDRWCHKSIVHPDRRFPFSVF